MLINHVVNHLFVLLVSFFLTILVAPLIMKIIKQKKAKQEILSYVTQHNSKAGVLTMGGVIFAVSAIICAIIFSAEDMLPLLVCLLVSFLYLMVGFYDDYKKIQGKKNEGLTPKQKLFLQLVIAIGFSVYLYFNNYTFLYIPFIKYTLNLSWGIIPISVLAQLYFTNAVNLLDGLDGLCSSITAIVACFFGAFLCVLGLYADLPIANFANLYQNLSVSLFCLVGAILGFIFFNSYPAKIFMGDTGSLFLGGILSTFALISGQLIVVAIVGVMYLVDCLSVIIQVLHFKRTGKRVFLMAPLHHHYEKKGVHEHRIVVGYSLITVCAGIVVFLLQVVIN